MVVVSTAHGDLAAAAAAAAAAAVADELLGAGVDLETFFDYADLALEVPVAGGGRGKDDEEELEWLSNKDAFPTVETMLPAALRPPKSGARRPGRVVVKKEEAAATATARRCRHCGAEETPQWRGGPEGAATLCNACGIRYRSGRLVLEYRPASSPTFCPTRHSNCHRSVLKMRRLREEAAMASPTAAADDNL